MGLTLEFVLGNPEAIRKAVEEVDLDSFDDPAVVEARADFSMHITPYDLDTLSEEFASISGLKGTPLRSHLEVLFDDVDRGVLLVDDDWIAYVAAVPAPRAREATERWFAGMSREYQEPMDVTDPAVQAVEELLLLCARAKAEARPLVHLWFL